MQLVQVGDFWVNPANVAFVNVSKQDVHIIFNSAGNDQRASFGSQQGAIAQPLQIVLKGADIEVIVASLNTGLRQTA